MSVASRFVISSYFLASFALAQQDLPQELRHLTENWPVTSQSKNSPSLGERRAPSYESIVLQSKMREINKRLNDLWVQFRDDDSPRCGQSVAYALEAISLKWKNESPKLFECQEECQESLDAIAFVSSNVDRLETALESCLSAGIHHPWYLEEESGLGATVGVTGVRESNPGQAESAAVSTSILNFNAGLKGVVKTGRAWHRASFKPSYIVDGDRSNLFLWDYEQKHVFSLSRAAAVSVGGELEKKSVWIPGVASSDRAVSKRYLGNGDFSWRSFGRRLELGAYAEKTTWDPSLWGSVEFGAVHKVYLQDVPSSKGFVVFNLSKRSFEDSLAIDNLWTWGAAYRLQVRQSNQGLIDVKIGFQDERDSEFGSKLWPDLGLSLESDGLSVSGVKVGLSFQLSPEVYPWSISTLELAGKFQLSYSVDQLELPLELSLKKQMHRGLPGGRRNDRVLGVGIGARYEITERAKAQFNFYSEKAWIPTSASSDIAFAKNSYKNISLLGGVQYEF